MIKTAKEFIQLRQSENTEDQYRASHDLAEMDVWLEIIDIYPEFKKWVIHNKTIPIEILETLCHDNDPNVRSEVARKRKINDKIFNALSIDVDENVRYALMCNTKLTIEQIKKIKVNDSVWLAEKLSSKLETLK